MTKYHLNICSSETAHPNLTKPCRVVLVCWNCYLDGLMNGQIANILQSFDVPMKGDFSFPKQRVKFFPDLHLQYPLGTVML
jgi:hypothetical protein